MQERTHTAFILHIRRAILNSCQPVHETNRQLAGSSCCNCVALMLDGSPLCMAFELDLAIIVEFLALGILDSY